MTKLKSPFASFKSSGTVGNTITTQTRYGKTFARTKPIPTDPKSLAQAYQRWNYQDYANLWHTLSTAQKQQYESNARPYHMTGFAYWMRLSLKALTNLAAHWRMDERTGLSVIDFSRNGNTGTITGATHVPGLIDYCLSFSGVANYVNCGNKTSLRISTLITIELLLNPTSLANKQFIDKFTSDWVNYFNGWRIDTLNTGKIRAYWSDTTIPYDQITSLSDYTPGAWNHIAFTLDGTDAKLYLNGNLDISQPQVKQMVAETISPLYLGGSSTFISGLLDDARIYNRALSPEEIKIHSERKYPL